MHYIVAVGAAGRRYLLRRNATGRVKISLSNWTACPGRRYDVRGTFHPFYTTFFLALAARPAREERTSGKEREVTNGGAEINCLSAVCLESRACESPVSTRPVCSSSDRNIVSADRRLSLSLSLSKDLRVIIAGTAQCCRAPENDGKNVYFISRFFQDTVVRMVVNQQMSATLYNYH